MTFATNKVTGRPPLQPRVPYSRVEPYTKDVTDTVLIDVLGVGRRSLTRWRKEGFPHYVVLRIARWRGLRLEDIIE